MQKSDLGLTGCCIFTVRLKTWSLATLQKTISYAMCCKNKIILYDNYAYHANTLHLSFIISKFSCTVKSSITLLYVFGQRSKTSTANGDQPCSQKAATFCNLKELMDHCPDKYRQILETENLGQTINKP